MYKYSSDPRKGGMFVNNCVPLSFTLNRLSASASENLSTSHCIRFRMTVPSSRSPRQTVIPLYHLVTVKLLHRDKFSKRSASKSSPIFRSLAAIFIASILQIIAKLEYFRAYIRQLILPLFM